MAHAVVGTSRGKVRPDNQDKAVAACFVGVDPRKSFRVFIICDGLGGLKSGERCAASCIAYILERLVSVDVIFDRGARLHDALRHASAEIASEFGEQGGTTVCAVLVNASGATGVSVGDSRIYEYGTGRELNQLTKDDTLGERLAEIAKRPASPGGSHPFAHQLAQMIGQRAPLAIQTLDLSRQLGFKGRYARSVSSA
jgi:serine/threonine protein phosphatase PrpC